MFSLEWPLRSWIIVTTQFRGGVNRILGSNRILIREMGGEGRDRFARMKFGDETERARKEKRRITVCAEEEGNGVSVNAFAGYRR